MQSFASSSLSSLAATVSFKFTSHRIKFGENVTKSFQYLPEVCECKLTLVSVSDVSCLLIAAGRSGVQDVYWSRD